MHLSRFGATLDRCLVEGDSMDELTEFLLDDGKPADFEGTERTYVINDEDGAIWAMRNIATAVRRLNDIKRQAADEVDRITRWVELTSKSPQKTVEYFEKALKEFMVRLREETGRKSLELPDGTVKSRQSSASVEILDIETFIKWAENNGHAGWVRVKKEIDKAAVRDGVEFIGDAVLDNLTGEVVDGVTVSPESVSVSITVSE